MDPSVEREKALRAEKDRTEERLANPVPDNQLKAKIAVVEVYNDYLDAAFAPQSMRRVTVDDIYVVSYTFILRGWKAMLSSDAWTDTSYFEVTYNQHEGELYVDHYQKLSNRKFYDDPIASLKRKLDLDSR